MVDTKTPGDKKLSVPSKTLSLKPRVETGTVRQSFSHGRSKQVVVEKRGKRRVDGSPEPQVAEVAKPAPAAAPKPAPARPAPPRNAGSGVVLRTLTEDERSARASALADAKVREVEERRHAEEEAQRRAVRESAERADREAAEARRKAEEERHRHEEEAKRKAETEAKKRFGEGEQPQSVARPATGTSAAPAARPGAPMARPGTTTTARPGTTTARPGTTTQRPGGPVGRAPAVAAGPDEDDGPRQIRRGPGGAARPVVAPKPT
ncbi:translation initiation factor IF-2 associated domain-containing protein, partial [Bradyrhizobium canariense]